MPKTIHNRREPANIRNLLIILSLVLIVSFFSYRSFLEKSRDVEAYDEFSQRLANVRVSITQLEYLMDMFVVAGRFENTTVAMIAGDVKKLDEKMMGSLGDEKFLNLIRKKAPLYESATSVANDWIVVKRDIARLNPKISKDELLLLHNSVDMTTVLIIEKIDRLVAGISDNRSAIFTELKNLVLYDIVGFIVASLVCALLIFQRFINPLNAVVRTSDKIASGEVSGLDFTAEGANMQRLSESLNSMLSALAGTGDENNAKIESLNRELNNRTRQIEALNIIMSFASRSLSQSELYGVAVKETTGTGCSDAAVVYLSHEGTLKLKASSGLGDCAPAELQVKLNEIIAQRGDLNGSVVFKKLSDYPDRVLSDALAENGFESAISVPIAYDGDIVGFFIAAYKERVAVPGSRLFFLESIATSLGVSTGHVNMFQKEFNFRRFYERILQQEPFGVIVLDRNGSCQFANAAMKTICGADPKFNFVAHYRIFEDESMMRTDMKKNVLKTLEGFVTEFEIDYDPSLMLKLGFMGAVKKLTVKTRPLFDSGGEISSILLILSESGREKVATTGRE